MKLLKTLDNGLKWIEEWILIITGTAVGVMILANAVCRFLKIDWFGSEELTLFVAFWLYFTGCACASRDKTHISAEMMDLFTTNKKIRAVVSVIKDIVSIAMCSAFIVWCYKYVSWQLNLGAKSQAYHLPVVIATFPILISFILWLFYLIRDLINDARSVSACSGKSADTKGGN